MNKLERPRFTTLPLPGWLTVLGVVISISLIFGATFAGLMLGRNSGGSVLVWALALTGGTAFILGPTLDKRLSIRKQTRQLSESGFRFGSLVEEYIDDVGAGAALPRLMLMVPVPLTLDQIERFGEFEGASRLTFMGLAHVRVGSAEQPWVFVVVPVRCELPMFAIGPTRFGRKRKITQRGAEPLWVDHPAFNKHRGVFVPAGTDPTESDLVAAVLAVTGDAFYVPTVSELSFRLTAPPGRHEQWLYDDGWLAYAEMGLAKAEPLLRAAELATEVAERLEAACAKA